jgi:hypothetical protein
MRTGCSRSIGKRGHHINLRDIYLGQGSMLLLEAGKLLGVPQILEHGLDILVDLIQF